MPRYIVVWQPGFERGMSRQPSVDNFRLAWSAKAPWLVARRRVEIKTTAHSAVSGAVGEWLGATEGAASRDPVRFSGNGLVSR